MQCVKLMGERVMARDFDRQIAELQVRAVMLNRFTQLGMPETVRVGYPVWGQWKRDLRSLYVKSPSIVSCIARPACPLGQWSVSGNPLPSFSVSCPGLPALILLHGIL